MMRWVFYDEFHKPQETETMFKPRNSLVLVRLFKKPEEQVGVLTVPTGSHEYTEAEIVEVGPDFQQAAGGIPSTSDLKPGQRVFVKTHRAVGPGRKQEDGLPLRPSDQTGGEGELWLFEQSNILAIVADPTKPGSHEEETE